MANLVEFFFDSEYADEETFIDYFTDCDDETGDIIVSIHKVEDELVENLTDEELCKHFGLNPKYLNGISINEDWDE